MSKAFPRSIGNYTLKSEISRRSFATVCLGKHKLLKTPVLVKIITNRSIATDDMRTRFIHGLSLMKQLDHPFLAKLYEIISTDAHTVIIQEFAERGSLLALVNDHERLSEARARRYFSQLLSALEYLHEEQMVVHRDLKAKNILLDRNFNIRLIDFGLSQTFSKESPELHTACGSPAYVAPEMIRGKAYTKSGDIWSAGILLYFMVVGQLPFKDGTVQGIFQKIAFTEPFYPPYLSSQLTDLLQRILVKNPDYRLTLSQIKQHPWLSQGECQLFLGSQFSNNEKFMTKDVERELIDQIAKYEVNVKRLSRQILKREYNSATAMYAILRREIVTDRIKDLVDRLNSSGSSKSNPATNVDPGPKAVTAKTMKVKPVIRAKLPSFGAATMSGSVQRSRAMTLVSGKRSAKKSDGELERNVPLELKFPIKHRRTSSLEEE